MKRTFAAVGLLVLGLVLGSAVGALAGKNLTREAEVIDQTLTSFAPIDVGAEQTVATTALKPLAALMPTRKLSEPLIIATNGSQGTNSDIWRWEPSAGEPERIPIKLPVDSWWYDERTGLLLGTLSDPATRSVTLIRGPLDGPFEKVADGISHIFPALDELPTPTNPPGFSPGTIFGGPLTERIYSEKREDGLYLWSADYSGPTPFHSEEIGPFQNGESYTTIRAGAFPGGAYVAIFSNEGTTVTTFTQGEIQELSFDRAIVRSIGPPDILALNSFDGFLYLKLSTLEVMTVEPLSATEYGCAVFASDSIWMTCQGLGNGLRFQAQSLLDESILAPGRMVGFLATEGVSFSHRPAPLVTDPHALVALDEGGSAWTEVGFFDAAIYGVWSER